MKLTNLDQPLSPDAGATKRDLVDYLDVIADPDAARVGGPAADRASNSARAGAVHAEERAEVHPGLGEDRPDMGRGVQAGGALRVV